MGIPQYEADSEKQDGRKDKAREDTKKEGVHDGTALL